MKLTITMDLDNAAFEDLEDGLRYSLSHLPAKLAQEAVMQKNFAPSPVDVRDVNGNTVGEAVLSN